jgi:6,7-dimethyl-8-ribityllumazine synthase
MSAEDHTSLPLPEITPAPHLLLVVAPYYRAIADDLVAGAAMVLGQAHATHEVVDVPGALEIPPAIRLASRARRFEGFVALGCVLRGETTHYETVCNDSSRGLMLLGLDGLCIGNGILTCETMQQAQVRAASAQAGGQDKGGGAAAAALHLVALARRFGAPGPAQGPGRAPDDAEFLLAGGTGLTRTA